MPDRLIFLDVDGVLTSTEETPGSYLNHGPDEYGISPKCLQNLKLLCRSSGAKIVISSSWRNVGMRKYGEVGGKKIPNPCLALYAELGDLIVGAIPKTGFRRKAEALVRWFDENEFDGDFVILDDDEEECLGDTALYSIGEHFVLVDHRVGLQPDDCERAMRILTARQ